MDESNGLLPDDKLTILCRVRTEKCIFNSILLSESIPVSGL